MKEYTQEEADRMLEIVTKNCKNEKKERPTAIGDGEIFIHAMKQALSKNNFIYFLNPSIQDEIKKDGNKKFKPNREVAICLSLSNYCEHKLDMLDITKGECEIGSPYDKVLLFLKKGLELLDIGMKDQKLSIKNFNDNDFFKLYEDLKNITQDEINKYKFPDIGIINKQRIQTENEKLLLKKFNLNLELIKIIEIFIGLTKEYLFYPGSYQRDKLIRDYAKAKEKHYEKTKYSSIYNFKDDFNKASNKVIEKRKKQLLN